jgi:hypothetical protein
MRIRPRTRAATSIARKTADLSFDIAGDNMVAMLPIKRCYSRAEYKICAQQ